MNLFYTSILCCIIYQIDDTIQSPHSDSDPLILTPLIENHQFKKALQLSKVKLPNYPKLVSYSGYFTVDKYFGSNLFFWFFPTEQNFNKDPLILWLQVTNEGKLERRNISWTKNHSILYIDQPVGTGFSFTHDGYAENQTIISKHLCSALTQFFKLFPEIQKNSFFIAGESYAGKYIPALGYAIKQNEICTHINLQGLIIGNGLIDPENQMKIFKKRKFMLASNLMDQFAIGYTEKSIILNTTGLLSPYNYLLVNNTNETWTNFINNDGIKRKIHVGGIKFDINKKTVEKKLWLDIPHSQANILAQLLSYYRILLYSGQDDILVGYPSTINFISKLNFTGANDYNKSVRRIWIINQEISGYIRSGGNLTEVLVRNAGHMVPLDQPKWCYNLISNFIRQSL
ncbi:hypothetical protein GWI33_000129 [Rhynchophorus ferrugineus]|uniref:Carboxypeptidase n=1 Tax=Rhynchophorus ferrugineus TaxID=354439 RepID=A0A834MMC1_RHYFE|nr:hypothetical protein GWI33_000129 [Rhynchophorus ferrugineus]